MHIYIYIYIYICISTHINQHTHTGRYVHVYIFMHTHSYSGTSTPAQQHQDPTLHKYTYTHAHANMYTQAYRCEYMHNMHSYSEPRPRTAALRSHTSYKYTCTQIYMHTCICNHVYANITCIIWVHTHNLDPSTAASSSISTIYRHAYVCILYIYIRTYKTYRCFTHTHLYSGTSTPAQQHQALYPTCM